ncbi:peptide synthetase [Streptomyces sp. CB03234]|uniref:non-ribosomal peptide synthetase n=1 Tax=Streptomyces sp. (strain CB03234) TaxID=1703937 RepID=UPI00093C84A7|nr:amino acid adenylation domain-containing protein [Streptomyces sp. CB03234]OKK04791.1 peptide synthetase [Streptomyces sp. CB03234]
MTITGAPQRLVPRWVTPGSTPAAPAVLTLPVPPRLAARTRLLARRSGIRWEALALAAHAAVLSAISGEQAMVTGYVAPSGGAPRPLALALEHETWGELAAAALTAAHAATPEAGDTATAAAGNTASATAAGRSAGGPFETVLDLGEGAVDDRLTGPVVLTAALRTGPEGLALALGHRTDVLDAEAALRVAGYHLTALDQLTAAPDSPVRSQSLLSPDELDHQLTGLSGPARELPDRRFHELFQEQAARRPDAVAASHAGTDWTYAELNARANRVAHTLLARDLGPEAVVAVVTERNLDWLAAVIGIFKAGAAYLPVEPHAPADRMARTLARSGTRLVLTEDGGPGHLQEAADSLSEPPTLLTVAAAYAEGAADTDPGVPVGPGQLAYLYFTSGSTGEPKGAMCEHAGFVNHLYAKIDDQGITEGMTVAQTAPQSFDISLWQLVAALVVGGRTLIVEQEAILDVDRYLDTVERGEVAVLQAVPSYLEVVLARLEESPRELPALRCVSVTGEALKKELAVRWFAHFPHIALMNAYGLTETSDDTNHEVMTAVPAWGSVPLGRPVGNVTVYVVDERLRPVPLGAPGEIVFSGVCVGRGYINDPERTAQAFTQDPHRPGRPLYRSGDFGRWLPGGTLEFLGRRDAQVKIRGFRIEIGEIENQLLKLPGVRDGAVVVVDSVDEGRHLVGFQTGSDEGAEQLRARLARTLPAYMVPRRLERLEALPLTPNGKTDKRALTTLAHELAARAAETAGHPLDAPRTDTERRLAEAWSEVLKVPVDRLARTDDFFDRGGTSLSAVRLIVRMDRAFSLREVMAHPTLAALAALIDGAPAAKALADESEAAPGTAPAASASPAPRPGRAVTAAPFDVSRTEAAPAVLLVPGDAGDPLSWATEHRARLRATVAEHGAVLVRGLGVTDADTAGAFGRVLLDEVMEEREGFAVRKRLAPGVYSSSEWPVDQPMCMHHELSYAREVPGTLLFACLTAPASGGVTGVADSHEVLRALPADLAGRFETEGWRLDRNYTETVGVPLRDAFGTGDRAAIEAYCAARRIECHWQPNGDLRTRQHAPAVLTHPLTGRRGWFNQIAFLNEWTLDPIIREYLTFEFGPDGLPFNSRYGSGAALDEDTVLAINAVYEKHTLREPWRAGDVMLVDNLRMAHSREPYEGDREIAVILGDPITFP